MHGQTRIEVAQIVTRFIAGAGGVALRGALNLDPDRYHVTIVTGQGGPLTVHQEQLDLLWLALGVEGDGGAGRPRPLADDELDRAFGDDR